ncbi:uncharacterized protein [Littorina saxatilis]|uniref:uncharacterized protein n=1 Tax=Littorina saxatilis TaxID=31220 RepID=UPI0038B5DB8C
MAIGSPLNYRPTDAARLRLPRPLYLHLKELGILQRPPTSVNPEGKADLIADYIIENKLDALFITETWLRPGDDPKIKQLTPAGYKTVSFPRPAGRGGGIAVVYKDHMHAAASFSDSLPFPHTTFEAVEMTVATTTTLTFLCIYRPPPNTKNKLKDSTFFDEFSQALDHYNVTSHSAIVLGDFNIHWDCPANADTKRARALLDSYSVDQVVPFPSHSRGHILDWIVTRPSDNLVSSLVANDHLVSDHTAINFVVNITKPAQKRKMVTRRKLRDIETLLDKHAPPSLCAVSERQPAPWFSEDITAAKIERRRAERAWRHSGLEVHRQILRDALLRVTQAITAAKVEHFHDRIANASSSRELFSIMSSLLGSSPAAPLPTAHPPQDIPELFSEFFKDKIDKLRRTLDQQPFPVPVRFALYT